MSEKNKPFLPYGKQSVDDDDIAAVVSVLKSNWLTTGPVLGQFETEFATTTGAQHAVACANGTAALHLSALALKLGPGDAVIVPTMTFLATANAVRYVGAKVIFADVDPDTGLLSSEILQRTLDAHPQDNIKAVFVVHMNGQCARMAEIRAIASAHGLFVVEDACHALGGGYGDGDTHNARVGSCVHSDITVFSFHAVKTATMGEGGLITTNDVALFDRLCLLRNHGMTRDDADFQNKDLAFADNGEANPWYYEMHELGFNYRVTDIQCALGLSQLKKLDSFVARRTELVALYDQKLSKLAPIMRPVTRLGGDGPAWHLYVALIDFEGAGTDRATVMNRLRQAGIGTQVHYLPVHRQPYYRSLYGDIDLPGADAYYARCLSLPLFPKMVDEDVTRVVESLGEALGVSSNE